MTTALPADKHGRSITDKPFLVIYFLFILVLLIVFFISISNGSSSHLLRGVDMYGQVCPKNTMIAWVHPAVYDCTLCVNDCSATSTDPRFAFAYHSEPFISHYCLPFVPSTALSNSTSADPNTWSSSSQFSTPANMAVRAMRDLCFCIPIFIIAALVSLFFSFLYSHILQRYAKYIVWGTTIFVITGGFLLSIAMFSGATYAAGSFSQSRATAMYWLGWISLISTILLFFMIWVLFDRIKLSISVTQEAAKSLIAMPSLMVLPFGAFIAILIYFIFWVFETILLFSITKDSSLPMPNLIKHSLSSITDTTYVHQSWDIDYQNYFVVHFFGLLWNMQLISYLIFTLIAALVADWFFSKGKSADNYSIFSSFKTIIFYHWGSLAFASFILAVVEMIRYTVSYIDRRSKLLGESRLRNIIRALFYCCFRMLSCCLDKLGKPALVLTAINGTSFIESSIASFQLIIRHLSRIAAINLVGDTLLMFGKLLVSLVVTALFGCFFSFAPLYRSELSSLVLPMLVVFLFSYTVSSFFMVIFETAIDTLFICFLLDLESKSNLTPASFKQLIDANSTASAKEAELKLEDRASDRFFILPPDE